jgi:PAS domain S-box-containing protein
MNRQRDLFRDLCENATDLIQSVAPEGRFLYVNRAWLDTLGYGREEVDGLTVFDVIHPDSREHCERVMRDVMRGEQAMRIEAEFRAKDGRKIAVEGTAQCMFRDGNPVATSGIFRDVSDRARARDELDRLFNLSLDLLCIAGTDGYFKHINPAFERVLGYTRQELLSRSFIEFVHPDDRQGTLREVENLASGRLVVDFRNRYRARDGSFRWLAWRASPLADQGLIYAVARDVTDEKRMQELMARQSAELARSNADLEQFAYVASHDLRAPLRAIANLSEWIEEDMPAELPEKVKGHIEKLRRRVERMEGPDLSARSPGRLHRRGRARHAGVRNREGAARTGLSQPDRKRLQAPRSDRRNRGLRLQRRRPVVRVQCEGRRARHPREAPGNSLRDVSEAGVPGPGGGDGYRAGAGEADRGESRRQRASRIEAR